MEMNLSRKLNSGEERVKDFLNTTNFNADMKINRSKEIKLKSQKKEVVILHNSRMKLKPEEGKAFNTTISSQHIKSEPLTDSDDEKKFVIDENFIDDMKQESEENFSLVLPSLVEYEDQKTSDSDDDIEYEFCDEKEISSWDQMFDFRQDNFSCEKCFLNFGPVEALMEHLKNCEADYDKKTTSECIQRTIRGSRLGAHQETSRGRPFLCHICGKCYTQSGHLMQHIRFHKGIKNFACDFEGCGKRFTIRPDLDDHKRKYHTGERPYLCEVCNKSFLTGSVYYQHRLIHRNERRYGCEECGKRFYRSDALKNHMMIHSGEKPYACHVCVKKFRQKGDLQKHLRARHTDAPPSAVSINKPRIKSFGRGRVSEKNLLEPHLMTAPVKAIKEKKIQENLNKCPRKPKLVRQKLHMIANSCDFKDIVIQQ